MAAAGQVAHQPGLEDVFADLLEYEDRTGEELGAEFYMDTCPAQLAGELAGWENLGGIQTCPVFGDVHAECSAVLLSPTRRHH